MSSRHTRSFFGVLLAAVFALSAIVVAPASAKLTKHQKAHIRHQLMRQIKKNPKLIRSKSFIKKASLVNFSLPVTIRLRGLDASGAPIAANGNYGGVNPNKASVDLGPSLGQREVDLGGALSGNVVFHDSYDGGALGNVDLQLLPDTNGTGHDHTLKTTSIPLLWNDQVTSGRFANNDLGFLDPTYPTNTSNSGCSDMTVGGSGAGEGPANVLNTGLPSTWLTFARQIPSINGGFGMPGYPVYTAAPTSATQAPDGYLAIDPGIDDITNVKSGDTVGKSDIVGANPSPFPVGTPPSGYTNSAGPNAQNTVLRTNALSLNIADPGIAVNQSTGSGPQGSSDIVTGKSGGEANLFGNIPGKNVGIDITASFATRISSIIRVVDQDSFHTPLVTGNNWPAGVFNCRQVWTGYVNNVIPGVRLTGSLKIAPGLTSDGHLRIAKALVRTTTPARFAVAACLAPDSNYAPNNTLGGFGSDQGGVGSVVPGEDTAAPSVVPNPTLFPATGNIVDPGHEPTTSGPARGAPDYACNTHQTGLIHHAGIGGTQVPLLTAGSVTDGYTTTNDGSRVSVAADLNVQNVSVDILIGDV